MLEFLFQVLRVLKFLQVCLNFGRLSGIFVGLLPVHVKRGLHGIKAGGNLLLVVPLSIRDYASLSGCNLLDLLHELTCLLLHLHRINGLLLKQVLFLFLRLCHLVFQVVLHFLVLPELDHGVFLGLKAMYAGIFVYHISPEAVLLSLNEQKQL